MPLQPPGLAPEQVFQLLVAAYTAIGTLMLALMNAALSLHQRWRDLRWKQAEMALKLVDDALGSPPTAAALELLDEHVATYEPENGAAVEFDYDDVRNALAIPPRHFDKKSSRVRHCFDSLFYYFDRFEQLVKSKSLRFKDIDTPWHWYASQLAKQKKLFEDYAKFVGYGRAVTFLDRYAAWSGVSATAEINHDDPPNAQIAEHVAKDYRK